ncbi:MAG: hypothetical protein A3A27_00020 [Candidatus Wildermuthbacteria bacterium RIFCSPLOWO2_01_FULL_47_18]|uniref:Uncharacterized protein n=1 Tax=Candidatus Wildermuthbacteria bacterium RIFCSPLOWO2_01_FULL_47_18 TaxID=1802460 RepID=A0A1G2RKK2_9BACT|nr:MAG: hypothetical protein A3A27_00020 [Candidatus Wildermuthbacteria bacterium RIFCSPLOWO2_01_FULL_47_18]HXK31564.1 hypothetical protein [Candidatus Paceibacterota bacterium]
MPRPRLATWAFRGGFLLVLFGVLVFAISFPLSLLTFLWGFALALVLTALGTVVMSIGLNLRTEPHMHFAPGEYGDDAGSMSRYPPHKPLTPSERRKMERLEREE